MKNRKGFVNEEIVEIRLRHFINKYYRIKIFQGLLITISLGLIIFLCLIIFGNAFKVGQSLQNVVLIGSGVIWSAVMLFFIFKPLGQRMGIISGLNFKEASKIIQQKHKSIEDRIINIVELTKEKSGKNNKLYDYAIEQKSGNIRDIKFEDAISFKKLGLYALRFLFLLIIFTGTIFLWPDFMQKGIRTIWSGNEIVNGISQIKFLIINDSLEVESGKDFLLKFSILSDFPVEDVNVRFGSTRDKVKKGYNEFEYLFKAVNSIVSFRIEAMGIISDEFILRILKKPEISGIQLYILPPEYTGLASSIIESDGNAEVPFGSRIIWTVKTVNTDKLVMIADVDTVDLKGKGNLWNFEKSALKNIDYELLCKNSNGLFVNYFYKISVAKDLYPTIDISESKDSIDSGNVYIQGIVQDDFGFSKLEVLISKNGIDTKSEIQINKLNIFSNFYYTIVTDSSNTVYSFRIWDNDKVTGPKFTDSRKISLRSISKKEIENINSQLIDSIKSNVFDGMNAIEKLEKEISNFKMEMILGDMKPWEIQEKLKELNKLKMNVVDFLNTISKTNKEYTDNEELLNLDKELTEKAKQIQELMENLLDDELKELLKQFEDLAKEFDSKKADEMTDKMEMNLERLKEQMEMSLELLKKYDMEKDLMKQIEKLDQLADSLGNDKSQDESSGKNLKDEFKDWEEEYEKTLKQDEQFKKPMGLEKLEKEREEVRNSAEELDKNEKSKSTKDSKESKSKASKGLKKLSKKLGEMLGMINGEGEFVDLEDLRQIRNSLNDFSKRQEELNKRILKITNVNPIFTVVIKNQKSLEYKFSNIRDSLKSIGYKQPIIAKIIGAEMFHVETSFKNLFESYAGNKPNVVRIEQNRIMSEINMIAVKLDELIKSMKSGKGSGKVEKGFTDRRKPKEGEQKGSEKLGETQSMQQSLKEQLKNSIKKMKAGEKGRKERGELAKMLGEREMMRKALERLTQGGGLGNEAKEKANEALEMMKEVEKDIIYNRMSDQTMEKDNLIKTKLLEAENAEKERENENRRESKEFKGRFEPNKHELEKGVEQKKAMEQVIKYNELKLRNFYQDKYLKYIESTKK